MIYLDANVFISANLDLGKEGEDARSLLRRVQSGRVRAASSALTFDEIVWIVKKNRTAEASVLAGEAFLNMPGLELIAVDGDLLAEALSVMRRYHLDPRDSIHAASAMNGGADAIVSADRHFDKVKEVGRKEVADALSSTDVASAPN